MNIWNKRNYIFKENERKNVNIGANHVRFHSFMEKHYVTLQICQKEAIRIFFLLRESKELKDEKEKRMKHRIRFYTKLNRKILDINENE
jgi:hypothetical protein